MATKKKAKAEENQPARIHFNGRVSGYYSDKATAQKALDEFERSFPDVEEGEVFTGDVEEFLVD